MEFFSSLNGIVKILFLPFMLLIIGGMIVFVNKRRKLIFKDKRILFLIITVLVMLIARLYFLDAVSSRFFSVLLIPTIPFVAYLVMKSKKYFGKATVRVIFVLVLCVCIGKALKPRRPKHYLKEMDKALNSVIEKSKGSTLTMVDFSGVVRYLRSYSNSNVKDCGVISKAPDITTQALFDVINSRAKKTDKIYLIFRSKGLEIAKKKYFDKFKTALSLKEVFHSKARREDGSNYIIARLVVE